MSLAAVAVGSPASAADRSARSFVSGLYKPYQEGGAGGLDFTQAAVARRVFAPDLARLWIRAQIETGDGTAGPVAFDPLTGETGYDVGTVSVTTDSRGNGRVTATVLLESASGRRPLRVDHELVGTRGGWRIDETHWAHPGGLSLRAILASD